MTPYEEGEAAYFRGESHRDNPYPKGSRARDEWARGMSNYGDPGL